jgi:folate-binding protein YgfZ
VLQESAGVDYEQLAAGGHVAAALKFSGAAIPCRVLRQSLFGFPGVELLLPRDSLLTAWKALDQAVRARGGSPIGYRALDMLRLEAGIPWFGTDFDEHHIPQEAAVESTHISFTKGCYTGQEIVERVRSRGHVNWRLTGVLIDNKKPPEPGTALLATDGTEAGHVTSAAFSPLAGKAIGMAYLRREYRRSGTRLRCGTAGSEVVDMPLRAAIASEKS